MTCNAIGVTITPVTATPTSGPWLFEYPAGRTYDQKASFPVIDLPKDTGCYSITFTVGGANNAVTFSPTNPILVNGVPPVVGNQIGPPSPLAGNGKQLIVTDQNSNDAGQGPLLLTYTLNFSGGDAAHRVLDPVIKNGGKSTRTLISGHASALEVATFAISLAVLITLVFVAYQLLMIRRDLARR
ncbi:MAG: hypothetical protein ACJ8F4_10365 [Sphingomonas sp.]